MPKDSEGTSRTKVEEKKERAMEKGKKKKIAKAREP